MTYSKVSNKLCEAILSFAVHRFMLPKDRRDLVESFLALDVDMNGRISKESLTCVLKSFFPDYDQADLVH